jgi:redox-sensitive bicupin YhaK (pirin superfamily)
VKYFRREFLKKSAIVIAGIFGIIKLGNTMSYTKQKKLKHSFKGGEKNWVGNGFNVYPMLRPTPDLLASISPFILMDYGAPKKFTPTEKKRGVGAHPHRGFETVTFAYQGSIEHRDSSGGGGTIDVGDVQWMTAGAGVIHDEFHSQKFAKTGGIFEMVQLWVNLPAKDKMTPAKYQSIKKESIPIVKTDEGVNVRVIAGEYSNKKGPSSTFTEMNIYDLSADKESNLELSLPSGSNTVILVLEGELEQAGNKFGKNNILIFERDGEEIDLKLSSDIKALVLNGTPIDEPVFAHGPFVMNTKAEIVTAINDFNAGKMGDLGFMD